MQTDTLSGGFSNAPVQSAQGFRAALSALARPGVIEKLSGATAPAPVSEAAATLLLVLCDPETPLYLAGTYDTEELRAWVAFHTGAPIVDPEMARFALGGWDALVPVSRFPIGTAEYPDRSTTLIVETDVLCADGAQLTGPGIETAAHLSLPDVQAFQDNRALFPQGLDFFFTCGDRVAGLPRSTIVEAG